ncbi:MAG: hypothetical protein KF779_10525 [Hyphomonadaceae bacterium]|nr:hypothetical protein [Hyphomonadaceae bacterium]
MHRRECFLCGQPIEGKGTKEHIFADAFLGEFDLKREALWYGAETPMEYSRIKVSAHPTCNSEQGSRFENYVLGLAHAMDQNLDVLERLHLAGQDKVVEGIREAFSQWLAKLHLGLIYWEVNLKGHPAPDVQSRLPKYLDTPVVKALQRCFCQFHSFNVPSSLYYFRLPDAVSPTRFDFSTQHQILGTFIRFGRHLLVGVTGDGYLTTEWFGPEQYRRTQSFIDEQWKTNPAAYLQAPAHIWAVRAGLPVAPKLEFTTSAVIDRSREGWTDRPQINADAVNDFANELYLDLLGRFRGQRTPWRMRAGGEDQST